MKVRAAIAWKAGAPLSIGMVDIEGPRAGEVLVEVMATGLCHTDAYTLSGADPEGLFPAILGHERHREQEQRSSYALVRDVVVRVLDVSAGEVDESMRETFSRIIFGAVQAAGDDVSNTPDPAAAVRRVEAAIGFLLEGLRRLSEQGRTLTDPG